MSWDAVAFDWNQLRAFLATVEEGSLSAAARALGTTQPTLSRQVSALEATLGVALIERGARSMTLTGPGRALLEHAKAMRDAAGRIALVAEGQAQDLEGVVTLSASDGVCAYWLPRLLGAIRQRAPGLEIRVRAENAISDLARREADVAIRHVRPTDPALTAKLARETAAHLYGAPSYFAAHGRPRGPEDLAEARFIGHLTAERLVPRFRRFGLDVDARNFRLVSNSGVAGWEMVKAGLGLGLMAREIGAATPGVEPVLPEIVAMPFPIWLVAHRELRTNPRIRLVFDALAEAFAQEARA